MTFEDADKLLDEIIAFLKECGGIYGEVRQSTQKHIIECLAVNQFFLKRDNNGNITHFSNYWMIPESELNKIEQEDEWYTPSDIKNGPILFIVDHGSKDGRKGAMEMTKYYRAKEPQLQGTAWNHKGEGIRFFPSQKGGR